MGLWLEGERACSRANPARRATGRWVWNRPIARRDFLNGAALALGAALAEALPIAG
jgi:hypothetical protein